ncbi:MAG: hypothetical protein R8M38_08610 [Mariprofundaceae bacterium]
MLMLFTLAGCEGMPSLIQWHEDDSPEYQKNTRSGAQHTESRVPLDVPPELRSKVLVPEAKEIAQTTDTSTASGQAVAHHRDVTGMAISLDAKVYDHVPGQVISAVIDAMTSLNLPVQSIDSPSGSVTSDWIRQGANNTSSIASGLFGGSSNNNIVRYRYVIRVLRMQASPKTRLEIRTLGQSYMNRHWVNKKLSKNVSNELFVAVEEQLGRHAVISE